VLTVRKTSIITMPVSPKVGATGMGVYPQDAATA
jgi:hypothetical protein